MKVLFAASALALAFVPTLAHASQWDSPIFNTIEYYHSDNCVGPLVGISDQNHSCSILQTPPNAAWSIRKDGHCFDIEDTTADLACVHYSNKDFDHGTYFFHSDTCVGPLVDIVDINTDCETQSTTAPVWSIWKNGQCYNIEDTNSKVACERFK